MILQNWFDFFFYVQIRTFLELDYMFHRRVPAYETYEVDMSALAGGEDEHRPTVVESLDEKKVAVEQIEVAPTLAK